MKEKDKIFELIIKELSSNNTVEEKRLLEEVLSKDSGLKNRYLSITEFWKNFFPKNKSHSIIEKTEKKLGFTYHNNNKTKSKYGLILIASVSINLKDRLLFLSRSFKLNILVII